MKPAPASVWAEQATTSPLSPPPACQLRPPPALGLRVLARLALGQRAVVVGHVQAHAAVKVVCVVLIRR